MITYLLNFVLCSGLLLLVYRAFLGNEKLYKFNRFYLLFSLVFSLAVPLITIKVLPKQIPLFTSQVISPPVSPVITPDYQQVVTQPVSPIVKGPVYQQLTTQPVAPILNAPVQQQILQTPAPNYNYLPLLIGVYLIIAIGLLLRFTKNLYQINRSVSKNAIRAADGTKLILVDEEVTPHSFLNYVFINKKDYRDGSIEPEIICHEQAHVQQLHSLDVIFVELLQVICWFNPVIPFYRRAIQLNHEFLADEAVIKSYDDTPAYQHLLLSKAGQFGSLYLTSQFNYLTTKKRLIMMTKTTSAKIALYKQLAILPVLAALVILFSNKVIAKAEPKKAEKTAVTTDNKKRLVFAAFSDKPGVKVHLNSKAPITMIFENKVEDAAKNDASQSVLNEYSAILKRNNIPYKTGEKINYKPQFTDADRAKIEALYGQMSRKQQNHQYIKVWHPAPPSAKFYATEKELATWKDAAQYGVWLDGNLINNSELIKYKAADFDYALAYSLPAKLANHVKFNNEVELMTKAFYAKYCEEVRAKKNLLMYSPKKYWGIDFGGMVVPEDEANAESADVPGAKSIRLQMVERPIYITIADNDSKIIPPATNDAPQHLIDEYAVLLKKYDISTLKKYDISTSGGSEFFNKIQRNQVFSKTDRLSLQDMFDQMSKKQQDTQIIQFGPLLLPVPKKSPDAEQLTEWRTKKRYRLYIDGKIVDRNELANYKPSDFDCYETGVLANDDPDYGKYKFEIDLMTPAFYAKDYKQTIDEKFRLPYAKGYSKLPDLNKMRKVAKADDKIQADKKATIPPDFVFITKPIPPSKHDAPESVLDEYATILKKYNLPPDTSKMHGQLGINFSTSNTDRLKLQDLFNQMSKAQQSKQQIQYGALELPSPKRSPTNDQLANWQDSKKFRVWIDEKKIDQKELAKYKAEDFDGWGVGRLSEKTNPNYKSYQYEVRLMTQAGYNNYYKQTVNDRRQMPMWTMLIERYSKRKAE